MLCICSFIKIIWSCIAISLYIHYECERHADRMHLLILIITNLSVYNIFAAFYLTSDEVSLFKIAEHPHLLVSRWYFKLHHYQVWKQYNIEVSLLYVVSLNLQFLMYIHIYMHMWNASPPRDRVKNKAQKETSALHFNYTMYIIRQLIGYRCIYRQK